MYPSALFYLLTASNAVHVATAFGSRSSSVPSSHARSLKNLFPTTHAGSLSDNNNAIHLHGNRRHFLSPTTRGAAARQSTTSSPTSLSVSAVATIDAEVLNINQENDTADAPSTPIFDEEEMFQDRERIEKANAENLPIDFDPEQPVSKPLRNAAAPPHDVFTHEHGNYFKKRDIQFHRRNMFHSMGPPPMYFDDFDFMEHDFMEHFNDFDLGGMNNGFVVDQNEYDRIESTSFFDDYFDHGEGPFPSHPSVSQQQQQQQQQQSHIPPVYTTVEIVKEEENELFEPDLNPSNQFNDYHVVDRSNSRFQGDDVYIGDSTRYLFDSTLHQISHDYSIPLNYLGDVIATWNDSALPINPFARLGDIVTGEQAFEMLEVIHTLDMAALHDTFSDDNLMSICEYHGMDVNEAFEFGLSQGWSLPFGPRSFLRVGQEEELLEAFKCGDMGCVW